MKKLINDRLPDISGRRQKLLTLEFISVCQNVPTDLVYTHSRFCNHTSWQCFLLVIVFYKDFYDDYGEKETNFLKEWKKGSAWVFEKRGKKKKVNTPREKPLVLFCSLISRLRWTYFCENNAVLLYGLPFLSRSSITF